MPSSISMKDTKQLLQLLCSSERSSFKSSVTEFAATFTPVSHFRVGCALVSLLLDSTALSSSQRLSAWLLLSKCGGDNNWADNPFFSIVLKLLDSTPCSYSLHASNHLVVNVDLSSLERKFLPGVAGTSSEAAASSDTSTSQTAPSGEQVPPGGVGRAPHPAGVRGEYPRLPWCSGSNPKWMRAEPGLMPCFVDELLWLTPNVHQDLVWDSTMGEASGRAAVVRELLTKALKGPLLPAQQQQVLAELEQNPELVHHVGLAPRHLPVLVENTPAIAFELLLKLAPSTCIHDYFEVLAHTDMNLHSMEVVNKLTTTIALPSDFVQLYISNCIRSCESTQDKYVQSRLVRLVCVFLQSLIRNRIINITDLLIEVQSFCINFSRIREAAKLFRLLKQIEAGSRVADSGPSPQGAGSSAPGSAGADFMFGCSEDGDELDGRALSFQ
eukprot:gene30295-35283_t